MTRETSLALVLDHLDSARAEVDDGYLSGALPLEVAGVLDRAVGVAQDVVRAVQSSAGGIASEPRPSRAKGSAGAGQIDPDAPSVEARCICPPGDWRPLECPRHGEPDAIALTLVLPRDAA